MEQIERIRQMEMRLDQAEEAVKELSVALEKYVVAQDAIRTIEAYYGSEEWRKDFEDDENGLLPKELKCGVLSEDGIWNMLEECRQIDVRMQKIVTERLKG